MGISEEFWSKPSTISERRQESGMGWDDSVSAATTCCCTGRWAATCCHEGTSTCLCEDQDVMGAFCNIQGSGVTFGLPLCPILSSYAVFTTQSVSQYINIEWVSQYYIESVSQSDTVATKSNLLFTRQDYSAELTLTVMSICLPFCSMMETGTNCWVGTCCWVISCGCNWMAWAGWVTIGTVLSTRSE